MIKDVMFKFRSSYFGKRPVFAAATILFFSTMLLYLPSLWHGFVNLDDGDYVSDNFRIRSLNLKLLQYAFSAEANAIWHPLTMISMALDYAVWKLNPMGYHLTNVVLHAMNSVAVFLLILQLLKGRSDGKNGLSCALVAALLFSIHPMRVESVAWISERKDVLYSFFFLLSLLMYAIYADTNKITYYFYSFIFFIFSLLSKPMAVTLPLIIVLMDFYPYNRLETRQLKRVLIEKIPFFLLSLIISIATVLINRSWGSSLKFGHLSLGVRIYDSVQALILYPAKMLFPVNLTHFYPPTSELSIYKFSAYIAVLIMIAIACLRSLKKHRVFFAIFCYYIVSLIPVLGLVKSGNHSMADRYTYLPGLGFSILAGLGFPPFIDSLEKRWMKVAGVATLSAAIVFFVIRTEGQISVWQDSVSLWRHEIKIYPANKDVLYFLPYNVYAAYIEKGDSFVSLGRNQEAIGYFAEAINYNKNNPLGYYKRGSAYMNIGAYDLAITDIDSAIKLYPFTDAYYKLGICNLNLGNYEMAVTDFNKEISKNPWNIHAYYYKGMAHLKLGDNEKASENFNKVVGINPKFKDAYELRETLRKESAYGRSDILNSVKRD